MQAGQSSRDRRKEGWESVTVTQFIDMQFTATQFTVTQFFDMQFIESHKSDMHTHLYAGSTGSMHFNGKVEHSIFVPET